MDVSGYTFVRSIREGVNGLPTTALYRRDGKQYIVRILRARRNTLGYVQIVHEASILRVLQSFEKKTEDGYVIRFPKLVDVLADDARIVLIREFVSGEIMEDLPPDRQLSIFREAVSFFSDITHDLKDEVREKLPRRSNFLMATSFPVYVLIAWMRDVFHPWIYLKSFWIFMKHIRFADLFSTKYILAHKDLQPRNIVINGKEIVIIDVEICLLAESGTDLARVFFAYWRRCGKDASLSFLESLKLSSEDRRKFLLLSSFLMIQLLAMSAGGVKRDVSDSTFDVYEYLHEFLSVVVLAVE